MAGSGRAAPVAELAERAVAGDRRALGRLLTVIERGGPPADEAARLLHPHTGRAHVVGITGPPGAGKSTIAGRLVAHAAREGRRPAVLAVDPSSPLSGGAILGDRVRMEEDGSGAFIRSMATRGHHGGLALAVPGAVRAFDAAGFDPVLLETVGVGQVEVDVVSAADTVVVVVAPGWGDAVQANKAGLLELADVLVVNKADQPGAADVRRDLELMLDLSHVTGHERRPGARTPVVVVSATEGTGIADLWAAVEDHRTHLTHHGGLARRRAARLRQEVRDRLLAEVGRRVEAVLAASPVEDDGRRSPAELAAALRPAVAEALRDPPGA